MLANKYPTRQLGRNGPTVSAIGYGAMGIGAWYGKTDEGEALETLTYAADRGLTFWDTADVYGTSEATLGKWFTSTGRRADIFLATKFGSFDTTPGVENQYKANSKPAYIRRQLESSLKELQTEWIDLYYQHRVDSEVPIEVVLETLRPYVESGKVKYLGLSECSIDVLRRAKAVSGVGEKVVAVQMEYSPFELGIESSGFVAAARELGVSIVAYSPLGRGLISGEYKSRKDFAKDDLRLIMPRFSEKNFPKNLELVDKFNKIATKYGATPSQATLAWILAQHPDFVPIPGTRSVRRLEENAKGAEIELKDEDVKALSAAINAADAHGARYPEAFANIWSDECIALSEWKGEQYGCRCPQSAFLDEDAGAALYRQQRWGVTVIIQAWQDFRVFPHSPPEQPGPVPKRVEDELPSAGPPLLRPKLGVDCDLVYDHFDPITHEDMDREVLQMFGPHEPKPIGYSPTDRRVHNYMRSLVYEDGKHAHASALIHALFEVTREISFDNVATPRRFRSYMMDEMTMQSHRQFREDFYTQVAKRADELLDQERAHKAFDRLVDTLNEVSLTSRPLVVLEFDGADQTGPGGAPATIILSCARVKLSGGGEQYSQKNEHKPACLSRRLPLETNSRAQAEKLDKLKLVEWHARSLLVLDDRLEWYWMMQNPDFDAPGALKSVFEDFVVDRGERGELPVMLLFTLARGVAVDPVNQDGVPKRRWVTISALLEGFFSRSSPNVDVLASHGYKVYWDCSKTHTQALQETFRTAKCTSPLSQDQRSETLRCGLSGALDG
ncbi:uncharacterized protein FIBRA_01074 [Fibroporia radiculosa]|uniref:NADP-dependent oxidoreductase domain-containing protein n=1 Tax=Fibroporia radiculosa TaxID=599839 RepID=J4G0S3_9APHY|nr:uncharacterized protein FIBRA_01074 [Fibroporia radiculosa]CCL99063.1 predicted protein [Fibroporia radiculosa]